MQDDSAIDEAALKLQFAPAALRAAIDRAAYYRLDPDTITLIDNIRGFGNKRTLRISRNITDRLPGLPRHS
jgi:hypothetical protein